jgi:hypothetical protein
MRHSSIYARSASAGAFASISGHNSSRFATRKRHCPRPMTTTGSMVPRSVKCLGIDAARPSRCSKYTRSSGKPSLLPNCSNSCPNGGCNGWTTRNHSDRWSQPSAVLRLRLSQIPSYSQEDNHLFKMPPAELCWPSSRHDSPYQISSHAFATEPSSTR